MKKKPKRAKIDPYSNEGRTSTKPAPSAQARKARRLRDLLAHQSAQLITLRNELARARDVVEHAARLVAGVEQSPVLHRAVKP